MHQTSNKICFIHLNLEHDTMIFYCHQITSRRSVLVMASPQNRKDQVSISTHHKSLEPGSSRFQMVAIQSQQPQRNRYWIANLEHVYLQFYSMRIDTVKYFPACFLSAMCFNWGHHKHSYLLPTQFLFTDITLLRSNSLHIHMSAVFSGSCIICGDECVEFLSETPSVSRFTLCCSKVNTDISKLISAGPGQSKYVLPLWTSKQWSSPCAASTAADAYCHGNASTWT